MIFKRLRDLEQKAKQMNCDHMCEFTVSRQKITTKCIICGKEKDFYSSIGVKNIEPIYQQIRVCCGLVDKEPNQ